MKLIYVYYNNFLYLFIIVCFYVDFEIVELDLRLNLGVGMINIFFVLVWNFMLNWFRGREYERKYWVEFD